MKPEKKKNEIFMEIIFRNHIQPVDILFICTNLNRNKKGIGKKDGYFGKSGKTIQNLEI